MAKGYIAGPMRGYPQLNFPAFDKAAALGRSLGYEIINPADLDRQSGIHEEQAPAVEAGVVSHPAMIREFVKRDTDALLSLRVENGDFIALLPGWEASVGAFAEWAVARWLKLKVWDARTFNPLDSNVRTYSNYTPGAFEACYNPRPASDFDHTYDGKDPVTNARIAKLAEQPVNRCDPELGCGLDDHSLLIIQAAKQAADAE